MKHQKVSVDVWAMVKTMLGYVAVVLLGGFLLRLVIAVVTMPRRFRQQREAVDRALKDLQERYPECFQKAMEEVEKDQSGKENHLGNDKEEREEVGEMEEKTEEEKKQD